MELTLRFLGLELLHLSASTDVAGCEHETVEGDALAYPMGFTAYHELPDEAGLRDRVEWDES
jgi:hypothetical protein